MLEVITKSWEVLGNFNELDDQPFRAVEGGGFISSLLHEDN